MDVYQYVTNAQIAVSAAPNPWNDVKDAVTGNKNTATKTTQATPPPTIPYREGVNPSSGNKGNKKGSGTKVKGKTPTKTSQKSTSKISSDASNLTAEQAFKDISGFPTNGWVDAAKNAGWTEAQINAHKTVFNKYYKEANKTKDKYTNADYENACKAVNDAARELNESNKKLEQLISEKNNLSAQLNDLKNNKDKWVPVPYTEEEYNNQINILNLQIAAKENEIAAEYERNLKLQQNYDNAVKHAQEIAKALGKDINDLQKPDLIDPATLDESKKYWEAKQNAQDDVITEGVHTDIYNATEDKNEIEIKTFKPQKPIKPNDIPITTTSILGGSSKSKEREWFNLLETYFPMFSVESLINDRIIWQKQLYTVGGEKGWFYFKIYFNFNTSHGLLCNLTGNENGALYTSSNNAAYYLATIEKLYKQEQIPHRMLALYKFGATLKSMQTDTPWVFKEVRGLDKINGANVYNFAQEKDIEILFNSETVDMRIGTMLDLYKYACYDPINCKEIIPANLRKFDMFIITYHIPILHTQTKIASDNNTINGKTTYPEPGSAVNGKNGGVPNDFSNMLSYKMYSFLNCEFDVNGLNTYTPSQISNESAFELAGNTLKIKYDRVLEHRMNEWAEFMFGDDGFWYNNIMPNQIIGEGKLEEGSSPYTISRKEDNAMSVRRNIFGNINAYKAASPWSGIYTKFSSKINEQLSK